MERKYSVREIDLLRSACFMKAVFGRVNITQGAISSYSYNAIEMNAKVEDMVRTYMLAGITAQDLYDSEKDVD